MSTERRSGSLVAIAAGEWPMLEISQAQNSKEMQKSILDCILNQESSPVVRIMNAVRWDDDKRLQRELSFYPTWHQNRSGVLRDALQLALELENTNAVRVCVENAAPVKEINLLALYDKLTWHLPLHPVKGKLPTYRRRVALGQKTLTSCEGHAVPLPSRHPQANATAEQGDAVAAFVRARCTQPQQVDPYEGGTPRDPIFGLPSLGFFRCCQTYALETKVKGS